MKKFKKIIKNVYRVCEKIDKLNLVLEIYECNSEIYFEREKETRIVKLFKVSFVVGKNRKQAINFLEGKNYLNGKQTGKGLKNILWAIEKIQHFIKQSEHKEFMIYIAGSDDRRYEIYKYLAKKRGLEITERDDMRELTIYFKD